MYERTINTSLFGGVIVPVGILAWLHSKELKTRQFFQLSEQHLLADS